ncbi:hypothetical protein Patl1_27553 [Pistacia atlantica]|uniref:Uncharacterized protein n=1 Tax=Pistacia atlantica TaxID=434234 RepID=A0ACC1BFU7_9ROSI|nr:hypothetical protein Patl1_27553 [Pistacia atlantica]
MNPILLTWKIYSLHFHVLENSQGILDHIQYHRTLNPKAEFDSRLNNNRLSGDIPMSLTNIIALRVLDLSNNCLSEPWSS